MPARGSAHQGSHIKAVHNARLSWLLLLTTISLCLLLPHVGQIPPVVANSSCDMSDPSSSTLESIFQAALERYEEHTREKLINHPLAQQLEQCNSVESITEVLQVQARAFNEFRRVESKVTKPLNG